MATLEVDVTEATRVTRALTALALTGGHPLRASEMCDVSSRTLYRWRIEKREEYERIRRDLAPQLEAISISELQAFVVQAAAAKMLALQKTTEALEADAIPARDLPAALRNITTAEAISVDKILALSGRPTSVVEHRSAGELVKRLAALGAVVDGTATELAKEA
jgi:transposase-like protein